MGEEEQHHVLQQRGPAHDDAQPEEGAEEALPGMLLSPQGHGRDLQQHMGLILADRLGCYALGEALGHIAYSARTPRYRRRGG